MPETCILSPARLALRSSPVHALHGLHVEETDTTIILRGTVTSYYQKQQALETIRHLLAGRALLNHVEVHTQQ